MRNFVSRINWPFALIFLMAVLAVLGRIVLVRYFGVPAIFRHHMADFCFAGLFTFVMTSVIAPFRQRSPSLKGRIRRPYWWLAIPFVGMLWGLWIEFEDYLGIDEEEGWFDPGVIIEWTNAPNTDTFDTMDLVAIALGGLLAILLQWLSVLMIDRWRAFPLLLKSKEEVKARRSL